MSRTSGWTRLRSSFVALGLVAGVASFAHASSMTSPSSTTPITDPSTTVLAYSTSSSIGNTGISGNGTGLQFNTVAGGAFLAPSNISLGSFQSTGLAAGQSTTYSNTPFDVAFNATALNGAGLFSASNPSGIQPNQTPINVGGVLNGTLSGPNQSTVTATFGTFDSSGSFTPFSATNNTVNFTTGLYTNSLTLPVGAIDIVPSTTNNGLTSLQAFLTNNSVTSPVPEPSTLVLFAATVVGLGFRHRLRKARATA
jgi:PEP-CTERM motif